MLADKKVSKAQAIILERLRSDSKAYVLATDYWDFQEVIFSDGRKPYYFKKRTREVLAEKGIIVKFDTNKYKLNAT